MIIRVVFIIVILPLFLSPIIINIKATSSTILSPQHHLSEATKIARDNGNYTGAISLLKQALQLDPKNPKVITNMGGIEADAGNYTGALFYFKKAFSLDPRNQGALYELGEVAKAMGYNSSAYFNFKQVLTQPALTDYEKLDHALSLMHLGKYSQALQLVDLLLKTRPTVGALNTKGEILLYQGNYTAALTIFNHLLAAHPHLDLVIENLGIALVGLHHFQQALPYFQQSVTMNSNDQDNWDGLAHVLQYMGNFTQALAAYNKALVLAPHNPDLLYNRNLTLGIVLYQSGNYSDAIKVYDATLKTAPGNPYLKEVRNLALYWEKGSQAMSSTPANYTEAQEHPL